MNDAGRISTSTLLTVIGLVFVGIRFFIRYSQTRNPSRGPRPWIFYFGDILCLVATGLTITYCIMYIWQLHTVFMTFPKDGFDGSAASIAKNMKDIKRGLTWGWVMAMIYSSAVWSVKGSLICIYYGASAGLTRTSRIALYLSTFFTIGGYVAILSFFTATCLPDSYADILTRKCSSEKRTDQSIFIISHHFFSDCLVMLVGVLVVRSATPLGRTELVALGFIFLLGLLTTVAASIRFGVQMMFLKGDPATTTFEDGMKLTHWMIIAALVEMNLALLAISLPSLRVWARSKKRGIITAELNENEMRLARIGSARSAVSRLSIDNTGYRSSNFKAVTFAIRRETRVDLP